MKIMGKKIRRVVTGHDENGVATVIMEGEASCILQRPNRPGVTLTNLWQSDKSPADMERHDDPVTGPLILHPPKNGSVFRIVQFDWVAVRCSRAQVTDRFISGEARDSIRSTWAS